LEKLFKKVIEDNITVAKVYHTPQTIEFMKELFENKPEDSTKATLPFPENEQENIKKQIERSLPKSTSRNHLIQSDCVLKIAEPKINNIYRELKNDLLLNDSKQAVPNAVGVLFRVFLEVSLDYYAKKNGHDFKKEDTIKRKIPWVVNRLMSDRYEAKTFNHINKVGSGKKEETILAIDNFHEYVHSIKTQASPSDLKMKWEHLQEFFIILWNEINKNNDK